VTHEARTGKLEAVKTGKFWKYREVDVVAASRETKHHVRMPGEGIK